MFLGSRYQLQQIRIMTMFDQFNLRCRSERSAMIYTVLIFITVTLIVLAIFVIYLRCSLKNCVSQECMKGKVVIVTGANAGIGFHTSMDLARRGARVILACRDAAKGTDAQEAITSCTGNTDVEYKHLDLSSLKSVRQFAANILDTEDKLHVLVNNAGVYGFGHCYTEDHIIETMQVNYYGHFLLTLLLLPLLKNSQPSRIVNLSSILHFFGRFDPGTVNSVGWIYNDTMAYCNSKYCMLMFTIELSKRLEGSGVVANAVHPGVIMTGITTQIPRFLLFFFWCWSLMYSRTAEQGAQTVLHLAVAKECEKVSGKYFVDCSSRYKSWRVSSQRHAIKLWELSTAMVGIQEIVI